MNKKQLVKRLKDLIQSGRKLARQINRKLESLSKLNEMKKAVQTELIKLCGTK